MEKGICTREEVQRQVDEIEAQVSGRRRRVVARAVVDPRGVMREFGLSLDDGIEVRVLDSTADLRYLVLPRRPAGTDNMSEEELSGLVTRDSMIGVAEARTPQLVAGG